MTRSHDDDADHMDHQRALWHARRRREAEDIREILASMGMAALAGAGLYALYIVTLAMETP